MPATTITAVLVDPFAQTVTDVQIPSYHQIGKQLAAMKVLMQCQWVEHVDLGEDQSLWVDEEGTLKDWDDQRFFCLRHAQTKLIMGNALAGRSLMTGRSAEGEIVAARNRADSLRPLVVWTNARQVVVPAMTIATAEFDSEGILRPTETPQPIDGDRRTFNYHNQPSRKGK